MNPLLSVLKFLCTPEVGAVTQQRAPDLAAKRYFWLHEIHESLQLPQDVVLQLCQKLECDGFARTTMRGPIDSINQPIRATKSGYARWRSEERMLAAAAAPPRTPNRNQLLTDLRAKPIWEEADLAVFYDVTIDCLRHMKSRNEIPCVVQINLRTWRVHRDAIIEYFKKSGMPKSKAGRPRGSKMAAMRKNFVQWINLIGAVMILDELLIKRRLLQWQRLAGSLRNFIGFRIAVLL